MPILPDLEYALGIVVGHDGGVWFVLRDRFFRLGDEATPEVPTERRYGHRKFKVAPDGTVWTIEKAGELGRWSKEEMAVLRSFDGEEWTLRNRHYPGDIEIDPAGRVWAAWQPKENPKTTIVGYFTDDGGQKLPEQVRYGMTCSSTATARSG